MPSNSHKISMGVAVFFLAVCFAPAASHAFETIGASWPSGVYSFRANLAKLVSDLPGSPFANTLDAEFWVTNAASTWSEQSGANVNPTYVGTTTAPCGFTLVGQQWVGPGKDGINTISIDECKRKAGTNDYFLLSSGETVPCSLTEPVRAYRALSGSTLTEVDICFLSNSNSLPYGAIAESLVGKNDVVGALVTMFGLAFGLDFRSDVDAKTVMHPTLFGAGNTLARFLYGDDIAGIQTIYGMMSSAQTTWRRRDTSGGWVSGAVLPAYYPMGPADGAIGHAYQYDSDYTGLIALGLGAPGWVVFYSAPYPMTSGSSWSGSWFGTGYSSHHPAAVSVNSGSYWDAHWAMGWVGKLMTKDTCTVSGGNNLWSVYSEHAFSVYEPLGWTVTTPLCSIHQPEIVYHPSNRFLVFYVNRDFASPSNNDKVFVRSAYSDPPSGNLLWSNAQALPVKSLGPVSAACSPNGTCALTVLTANTATPRPKMYSFTYDFITNVVTLGTSATQTYALQHRPAVNYRGADAKFTYAEAYASSGTYWDQHDGDMFSYSQTTVPFIGYSTSVGASTIHAPGLMEGYDSGLNWQYLLYVP